MKYEPGTLIQRRDGYVYLKTLEGKLMAHHRWVAVQQMGRPLKQGEVVIRKKPDRLNNAWDNLVVVQHALEKFKYLPASRVIYVPSKASIKKAKEYANRNIARTGQARSAQSLHGDNGTGDYRG